MELQEAIVGRTEDVLMHVLQILGLQYEAGILLMEAVGLTNWLFEYIKVREPRAEMSFGLDPLAEAKIRIDEDELSPDMTYDEVLEFVTGLFMTYYTDFIQSMGTQLLLQRKLVQEQ